MGVVTDTGQAASLRLYDVNADSWDGIVVGYDSASGGQAFLVSDALAIAYAADKAVRSDVVVLAAAPPCGVDCAGNPIADPSTITVTPGGLSPTLSILVPSGDPWGGTVAWDYGDGTSEVAGAEVVHTYALAGTYTVTAVPQSSLCFGVGTVDVTV